MACHEENPYAKFFGACNDLKMALDKCFVVSHTNKQQQQQQQPAVNVGRIRSRREAERWRSEERDGREWRDDCYRSPDVLHA